MQQETASQDLGTDIDRGGLAGRGRAQGRGRGEAKPAARQGQGASGRERA